MYYGYTFLNILIRHIFLGMNYYDVPRLEGLLNGLQGQGFDFLIHAIGDRGTVFILFIVMGITMDGHRRKE